LEPLTAVLIVLLPAASAAQEPVKSIDQRNTRIKVGDTVWVTDAKGREIKGPKLVVYRTPGAPGAPSARFSLAPVSTPRTKGVAVSFS